MTARQRLALKRPCFRAVETTADEFDLAARALLRGVGGRWERVDRSPSGVVHVRVPLSATEVERLPEAFMARAAVDIAGGEPDGEVLLRR